jgi:hypothetical protein
MDREGAQAAVAEMIETALFDFLAGQTEVQALFGEQTRTRFYPMVIPQGGKLPCVVYRVDNINRDRSQCATDRVVRARVQLDTYSKAYLTTINAAAAIRAVLVDVTRNGPVMMGSVKVRDVSIDPNSDRDMHDPEPGLFRRWQDYLIWYVE